MASTKRRYYDGEALTPGQHAALQARLGRPVCWPPHEPGALELLKDRQEFRPAEATFNGDMIHSMSRA